MIKTSVNTGVMSSGKVGVNRGVFICKNIYNRYSDLNAKQFMYATGISNNQIKDAIYRLCIDLKMAGIFDKCNAIYPFVGGTATSHSFNLVDPRNLDAAFRLSFVGGWTHSSTGALPNGTNGYANTFLSPVAQSLAYNNNHLSYYSRTQAATVTSFYEIGSGGAINGGTALFLRRNTNIAAYDTATATANRLQFSNTDGRGFYVGTSINTNVGIYQRNGVTQVTKNPLTAVSMENFNIYLGGFNEANTTIYYSNKECAFASIGAGLTSTEAASYNTIVQTFQVTLNRNV